MYHGGRFDTVAETWLVGVSFQEVGGYFVVPLLQLEPIALTDTEVYFEFPSYYDPNQTHLVMVDRGNTFKDEAALFLRVLLGTPTHLRN